MNEYSDRLAALKLRYPFRRWIETGLGQYTEEAVARFAAIFDRLIAALGAMGEGAPEDCKLAAFREAVEALNVLNEEDESLIETGEREQLCELCNRIATAADLDPGKYGGGEGPASEWRDW